MYQQDYSCKKRPAAAQIINVPDAFLCNPLIIRHLPHPPIFARNTLIIS